MIWWVLIGFAIIVTFSSIVIVLENRNPSKTVAWLIVMIFLPGIGFFCYLLIGRKFRKERKFRKKELHDIDELAQFTQKQLVDRKMEEMLPQDQSRGRLVNLILQNAQSPFTIHNRITVLTNGVETFHAIIQAISEATHHIHVQYYIWRHDDIGGDMQKLLIEKAQEGVTVRVTYDAVGSWELDKRYIHELRTAGVEVYPFHPVVFPLINSQVNYRNHRKIIVVDGKVAFMGGLNLGDEYLGKDPQMGFWRDTHLQVRGEAVYVLQAVFLMDWAFAARKDASADRLLNDPAYFPAHSIREKHFMQIAPSGPDSDWEAILQVYFAAIVSATRSIHITSPYFIPDDSILMAIKTAALSGIEVKLIIPARADHRIVFWATQSYVEELLAAGVQVYLYKKGFIHAKVLIVDGVVASLGTANMDIRSFYYNFEVNALIYDEPTVQRLEHDFSRDLADSRRMTLQAIQRRPFTRKLKESSARLFSPLL